jgi:hypothetical protein
VTLLGGDVSSGLWSLLVLVDVDSAALGLEEGFNATGPVQFGHDGLCTRLVT